jgi:CheY-like chemotaxis protein
MNQKATAGMATRVLVVDDEEDTLNLLKIILQISGYDPLTTLNSVDAITLAELQKPQVVLLDIMMPKLDGFTLCKMMRENPVTKELPIIFVTAYSALDIEDRRKEAGADLILSKPIGMDSLITTISQAMTLRKPDGLSATSSPPTPNN